MPTEQGKSKTLRQNKMGISDGASYIPDMSEYLGGLNKETKPKCFIINNFGFVDRKGNPSTKPHTYTNVGIAKSVKDIFDEYTGHTHQIINIKSKSAVKEFVQDTYGTLGTVIFKADAVAQAMNLPIKETYKWLYNAVHYGFLTQKGEDTFRKEV